MITAYVGIDPGSSSGGVSVIFEQDGKIDVESFEIGKSTEKDLFVFLLKIKQESHNVVCGFEKVHAMPGQGVSSVFTFGQNYGFIRGCLVSIGIPYYEITPQKWMKFYSMKKEKSETKLQWKKRLKQRAEQLYPDVKIKTDIADSMLIANYVRHGGI
jgi:crossover junction endodeoxyribonuclease RuvC